VFYLNAPVALDRVAFMHCLGLAGLSLGFLAWHRWDAVRGCSAGTILRDFSLVSYAQRGRVRTSKEVTYTTTKGRWVDFFVSTDGY